MYYQGMYYMTDGRSFWACSGLQKALANNDKLPKHIVSGGKKQSSKSANQYWSFQMIYAEYISGQFHNSIIR